MLNKLSSLLAASTTTYQSLQKTKHGAAFWSCVWQKRSLKVVFELHFTQTQLHLPVWAAFLPNTAPLAPKLRLKVLPAAASIPYKPIIHYTHEQKQQWSLIELFCCYYNRILNLTFSCLCSHLVKFQLLKIEISSTMMLVGCSCSQLQMMLRNNFFDITK